MLRRRGGGGDLPTFTSNQTSLPDGSGKSIKMEAPIVKAVRTASVFTKWTYGWLFISSLFMWGGWTWIRRKSASIIVDCKASKCTITIQPPYDFLPRNTIVPSRKKSLKRKTKIEIDREQLVRADNIKWDPLTQSITANYGSNSPTYSSQQTNEDEDESTTGSKRPTKPWNKHNKKKRKGRPSYRSGGPDDDGFYDSYVIVLRDPLPAENLSENEGIDESPSKKMQRQMQTQHKFMENDPNSLSSLLVPFAIQDGSESRYNSRRINENKDTNLFNTEYIIHPRDFNVGQTRRLSRTAVAKINAYTKGRRTNFILRESRPVAWQGLILLILGIFSFVLCLLLGQFYEESDPTKEGSYRKRMAEIKKRNEAMNRKRKNIGKKPLARALSGTRAGNVGGAALKSAIGANQDTRPNAGTGYPGRGY